MEVWDRFTRVSPVIDHDPKAVGQAELFGDHTGCDQKVPEDRLIGSGCFADPRYQFFRYDEQVNGRLWLDVVQHDADFILVFDACGDFPIDDPLEDSFHKR